MQSDQKILTGCLRYIIFVIIILQMIVLSTHFCLVDQKNLYNKDNNGYFMLIISINASTISMILSIYMTYSLQGKHYYVMKR